MSDKKDSIGALWKKVSKGGKEFMSGNVEIGGTKYSLVVFTNGYKEEGSNKPDFLMYESEPRDNQTPTEKPRFGVDEDEVLPF